MREQRGEGNACLPGQVTSVGSRSPVLLETIFLGSFFLSKFAKALRFLSLHFCNGILSSRRHSL